MCSSLTLRSLLLLALLWLGQRRQQLRKQFGEVGVKMISSPMMLWTSNPIEGTETTEATEATKAAVVSKAPKRVAVTFMSCSVVAGGTHSYLLEGFSDDHEQ